MIRENKYLEAIGFDTNCLDSVDPETLEQFEIARVIAVHKESYTLSNGVVEVTAELLGKLMYSAASPLDYPAVGDWVMVKYYDDNSWGIIHEILPRTTLLKRKTPGKKVDFQVIAVNIDVAFIVQSLNENFNLRRLERYLVMVNENKIKPIVLLSKSDLLTADEITGRINEIQEIMPGLETVIFSNENQTGLEKVRASMQAQRTYCLLGSSGVGKTTLINNLIGEAIYKTKTVSKNESKGRHATTHRQLIQLDSGALVIDTPGMRELGNISVAAGLDETFSEIFILSKECRFHDCSHIGQEGCAVLKAVDSGELSPERYDNYLKMTKESNYNEMSYLEKRSKDKQFGKHVKAMKKHIKSRR